MNSREINYEQEINLLDVLRKGLRSRKLMVIAAVIGALLLSAYSTLTTINPDPVLVMSADELAQAEMKITENDELIAANKEKITANEASIIAFEESINANETAIKDKKSEIKRMEKNTKELEALEKIYQQTVDAALTAEPIGETYASDIMSLTVKIADTQHAIYENESRILSLKKEIKGLEEANEAVPDEVKRIKKESNQLEKDNTTTEKETLTLKEEMTATITPEFNMMNVVASAVVGLIGGVVVVFGCILLKMLFDRKLHNANDLEDIFELHLLGTVYSSGDELAKKNKLERLLDRCIGKSGDPLGEMTNAEKKVIVAEKIKLLSETGKVMVIGTVSVEALQCVAEELKSGLSGKQMELQVGGNPLYSAETMHRLKDYELVLVEKVDETNFDELKKLVKFLRISKVFVLGVIEG